MEKEKGVILDEITSYLDQPEEAINDDFEDQLFAGHPFGRNILGTPETVNALIRADILNFIKANYKTDEIVVAVIGDYALNKFIKIGTKHFESVPANLTIKTRVAPIVNPAQNVVVNKQISQAHVMMGTQAYSLHHPYKAGLLLLNNMLGGTGMSSILNLQIREKHGIAYTIEF